MVKIILVFFNFSKNILRIHNKDYVFFGIEKIQNQFYADLLSQNNFIQVYKPDSKNNKNGWQGRLCWDIPFLCSYEKIKVNNRVGDVAYMQVKDLTKNENEKVFIFNGWTFASDPSLTPFDHAIYDLQLLNCFNV